MSYLWNAFGARAGRKSRQLFVFTVISGVLMMGAAHAQSAFGWLEFKPVPGRNLIQITGRALALEAVSGMDFTLSLCRRNGGNTSNTRQAGRFDLAPNKSKVLATASINAEPGDELTIEFKILDHGREVSSATVSTKPSAGGQTL